MRIALFHGFTQIHYEMMGYLIDYCLSSRVEFDIFAVEDSFGWKQWYADHFGINVEWQHPIHFDGSKYDYIVVLTDDDPSYRFQHKTEYRRRAFAIAYGAKTVYIDHHADVRTGIYEVLAHVATRDFASTPRLWALPTYIITPFHKKVECVGGDHERLHIACVGNGNVPYDTSTLTSIFPNAPSYLTFHCINRKMPAGLLREANGEAASYVKCYECADTVQMMDILAKCSHVLCLTHPGDDKRAANIMSGVIPLSFAHGCQLILPQSWQDVYKFTSALPYAPDTTIHLDRQAYLDALEAVYKEASQLVHRRNCVFDRVFQKNARVDSISSPVIESLARKPSWFRALCKEVNMPLPNVFVETGTLQGDGIASVIDDFREVHSIELKKDFVDHARQRFNAARHVHLHHGDSAVVLQQLNFMEPVLYYLDAHWSGGITAYGNAEENGCPILRELAVLSTRAFADVIIIDDMHLMGKTSISGTSGDIWYPPTEFAWSDVTQEKMLEAYKKACVPLLVNNNKRLVLLPV